MDESLMERRRVRDEGLRVVNRFSKGRSVRITLRVMLTQVESQKVKSL